ncbi:hypothetical protein CBR_g53795 [Chara braunii]|uniref:Uncharacterized protein n=1 Tax=Chara braunii TaxID=69332 RepID=A0A388K6Y8_CHABU|nr:hypothetical protein CBR_g53795 [Chara braunii]|eukprot:GBG65824.1 hypothetical protein CBR_g53795 [Chara braunii]
MAEADSAGGGNKITLDELVKALDRRDLTRGSVPKVETFLFKGERVSDWLELVEQAMVGVADAVKFQRILKYVYHGLHEEVKKVMAASNDDWSRFKDGMQRKYQLGDGLLTAADLETVNKNDYTTVWALAEDFKKKARKDLQRLNAVTVRDAGGLPNADALSESCAGRPVISLINLYSGYDQFLVYPPDRPVIAMSTPRRLIHMNIAAQGWTNAVAMVQRHMIRAMQTVSPHITQPYIDDLAVKGPREREEDEVRASPSIILMTWHIQDLDRVLSLLEEYNLTASGPKSKHCMREATILGFVCNKSGRRPDVKKTDKIVEWSVPFRSITDVRSFLGTCGFLRSFMKNSAAKTEHVQKLVRQDQEWVWGEDQEEAAKRMKGEFKEGGLVLGALKYEVTEVKPFIIETDVGPTALGGVLVQADAEGKERPLRFESRTLNTTERNYSQFKKETLVVLHCLRIFRNYVFGRRFILRVDPTVLACSLKNYTPSDPTVARWLTYIWMFNFELERIPGDKNMADGLSRINWDRPDQESVEDTPPIDGFLDQEEDVCLHINEWSGMSKRRS